MPFRNKCTQGAHTVGTQCDTCCLHPVYSSFAWWRTPPHTPSVRPPMEGGAHISNTDAVE